MFVLVVLSGRFVVKWKNKLGIKWRDVEAVGYLSSLRRSQDLNQNGGGFRMLGRNTLSFTRQRLRFPIAMNLTDEFQTILRVKPGSLRT